MLGVFCLEGNWQPDDLRLKDSVEPVLQLLQYHGVIEYIRRDIATRAELDHYISLWASRRYERYEVCYFAFHGDEGKALMLDEEDLTLRALGNMIKRRKAGRRTVIHIASCWGLAVTESALNSFLEGTGAVAVCGYSMTVNTVEAAAFEALMFQTLNSRWKYPRTPFEKLRASYPDLWNHLGFRVALAGDGVIDADDS